MKGWEGAALGVLLGGVAMPIVVHSMKWDEQGDGVPAVAFAPLGALIGLVVGGSVADER